MPTKQKEFIVIPTCTNVYIYAVYTQYEYSRNINIKCTREIHK